MIIYGSYRRRTCHSVCLMVSSLLLLADRPIVEGFRNLSLRSKCRFVIGSGLCSRKLLKRHTLPTFPMESLLKRQRYSSSLYNQDAPFVQSPQASPICDSSFDKSGQTKHLIVIQSKGSFIFTLQAELFFRHCFHRLSPGCILPRVLQSLPCVLCR